LIKVSSSVLLYAADPGLAITTYSARFNCFLVRKDSLIKRLIRFLCTAVLWTFFEITSPSLLQLESLL